MDRNKIFKDTKALKNSVNFSVIIFFLIFNLSCSICFGQEVKRKVLLKIGKHRDFKRIVLSYDAEIFNDLLKVNVIKNDKIKISFPEEFTIEFQNKTIKEGELIEDFYLKKIENQYIIEAPQFKDFKIYKLTSPNRVVIDLYSEEKINFDKPLKKIFIIIDPGHGGKDIGIRGQNLSEKDLTLSIAKNLSAKLNQSSISNLTTRQADIDVSIRERLKFWETHNSDIFLSIHVSNEEVFRIYTNQQIGNQESKNRVLDEFLKKLKNRIEKNFSEPIFFEMIAAYGIKKQFMPFILLEIPKKSLYSNAQYLEKVVLNLFECIKDTATVKKRAE